jgi:hypothetical protein
MTCPSCDSDTSAALVAYESGQPCPHCGLPADAATQIIEARNRHANEELISKYTQAVQRAEKAEAEAGALRRKLANIRSALETSTEAAW